MEIQERMLVMVRPFDRLGIAERFDKRRNQWLIDYGYFWGCTFHPPEELIPLFIAPEEEGWLPHPREVARKYSEKLIAALAKLAMN